MQRKGSWSEMARPATGRWIVWACKENLTPVALKALPLSAPFVCFSLSNRCVRGTLLLAGREKRFSEPRHGTKERVFLVRELTLSYSCRILEPCIFVRTCQLAETTAVRQICHQISYQVKKKQTVEWLELSKLRGPIPV